MNTFICSWPMRLNCVYHDRQLFRFVTTGRGLVIPPTRQRPLQAVLAPLVNFQRHIVAMNFAALLRSTRLAVDPMFKKRTRALVWVITTIRVLQRYVLWTCTQIVYFEYLYSTSTVALEEFFVFIPIYIKATLTKTNTETTIETIVRNTTPTTTYTRERYFKILNFTI